MGHSPQESLENTINTMGTRTLGVHPSLSLDLSHPIFTCNYIFAWQPLGPQLKVKLLEGYM